MDAGLDVTVTNGWESDNGLLRGGDIARPREGPGRSGSPSRSSNSGRGRGALVGVRAGLRGEDILGVIDEGSDEEGVEDSEEDGGVVGVGVIMVRDGKAGYLISALEAHKRECATLSRYTEAPSQDGSSVRNQMVKNRL